jgi:hypothetical protein
MTNAKIEAFDGSNMALDVEGQKASIVVPPEAEIVKQIPADFSDIAVGARVQANGTVSGDTLTASTVTLLPAAGQRSGRGAASAAPTP